MIKYLCKKAVNDIVELYGSTKYNPDMLEIVMEKYYKTCNNDFCLEEKAIIWRDVTENINR